MKGGTKTIERPDIITGTGNDVSLEPMCQVVLYNDDVNSFDHVIRTLVMIFKHETQMAQKIATEAHINGKAIAEVESKEQAVLHKQQLQSAGLTAEVQEL